MRASLVFQLSKLCSLTLKAARLATGGAEWDALVAGAPFLCIAYFVRATSLVAGIASLCAVDSLHLKMNMCS